MSEREDAFRGMPRDEKLKSLSAYREVFGITKRSVKKATSLGLLAQMAPIHGKEPSPQAAAEVLLVTLKQAEMTAKISDLFDKSDINPIQGVVICGTILLSAIEALTEAADRELEIMGITWDDVPDFSNYPDMQERLEDAEDESDERSEEEEDE